MTLAGLEPAIPWFVVRCLIRWATRPVTLYCLEMAGRSNRLPFHWRQKLAALVATWLVGLGVWFSLRVREVPGSNPGGAHQFFIILTIALQKIISLICNFFKAFSIQKDTWINVNSIANKLVCIFFSRNYVSRSEWWQIIIIFGINHPKQFYACIISSHKKQIKHQTQWGSTD